MAKTTTPQYWDNTRYVTTDPGDSYLGNPTWMPDGYVDYMDEYAMQMALVNPYTISSLWARELCFHDKGDEVYGGSAYAFIPTETQVKSMIALVNINTATEGPVYYEDPQMNNLLQSLYQSATQLWQELRKAGGTGW